MNFWNSRSLVPSLPLAAFLLAAGCTPFTPQPLAPAKTAAQFEQRTLAAPELRSFLETNLHRQFTTWPAPVWDEEMLTLAAFYYYPSLDVARADWQVAAAGRETAAERLNPVVTGSILHEPVPDAPSPWIPSLSFDLPIETAGKRRLRTEQARHLSQAARYNVVTAAWDVRSRLHAALLDDVAAQQRVALLQQQVSLREDLANRLQSQFQAGAISTADVDVARISLVRAKADLAEARRLQAEYRPRLAEAIGISVSALAGAEFKLDLPSASAAEGLTAAEARQLALLGRADILSALADYAASQSALQLEVAKQYPDIHLSPGYTWNGGGAGEHDWQLGATVELPLLNRHQGPIAEAAARREASAARFRALQARVLGELETAEASFRASQANLAALDALANAEQARERAVSLQLQAGAADHLDALTAALELNAAQSARLEAEIKLRQAVALLEDAVQRPQPAWPSFEKSPQRTPGVVSSQTPPRKKSR